MTPAIRIENLGKKYRVVPGQSRVRVPNAARIDCGSRGQTLPPMAH